MAEEEHEEEAKLKPPEKTGKYTHLEYHPEAIELDEIEKELERRRNELKRREK
jgi:hypothetical protein